VAMVMLIGLLGKNAVLILEFGIRKGIKKLLKNWLSQDICVTL
jgi:multidrug efflux pump subunit AcrB